MSLFLDRVQQSDKLNVTRMFGEYFYFIASGARNDTMLGLRFEAFPADIRIQINPIRSIL